MSAIIDIIGATIAGGMVLITIITTIFNIQRNNFNTNVWLNMKSHAQTFINSFDQAYLENVGRHMLSSADAEDLILTAETNMFSYNSANRPFDPTPSTFVIEVTGTPQKYVIEVKENGVKVYDSLPFYLANNDIFVYYDSMGNVVSPGTHLDQISLCRVNLVFNADSWDADPSVMLNFPITFWRNFKNITIR
jgi:hypothetical protein